MLNLKQKFQESLLISTFFVILNFLVLVLFSSSITPLNKKYMFFINIFIALPCIYFIYRDLKLLIHFYSKFSHLGTLFELTVFLFCVVCVFNSYISVLDTNSILHDILFILSCVVPFYIFFIFLSFHLLSFYKKSGIFSVNLYFYTVLIFALISASFFVTFAANLFLCISYLSLSFIFLELSKSPKL